MAATQVPPLIYTWIIGFYSDLMGYYWDLPSGKHTKSDGIVHVSLIYPLKMMIFHSYGHV